MNKTKLPKTIDISGHVEDFLKQFAEAVKQGYVVVPSFYSPAVTPMGLMMATMELPD